MFPVLAAAFVAASFAASVSMNKKQSRIEQLGIDLDVEQTRLQAAEAAFERTKRFRQNASMNLALQGMGFGSSANIAALSAENFAELSADINAINRGEQFAALGGKAKKAISKTNKFARDVGSFESAASLASKLGLFGG